MALLAGLAGCTATQRSGLSPSYLVIANLQGASGAHPGELRHTVASDVITLVRRGETTTPTVFADAGVVTFALGMRDPGSPVGPTIPTPANFVTVTHYRVRFIRADGRNTPGVDVPFGFDGAATATVTATGGALTFTLVRAQAKHEAPLAALANANGQIPLSTLAEVTFYGTDQAGRDVVVTGHIGVDFADWSDPI